MSRRINIFDTTLRDGEQSPGISLNTGEKLEIAKQLARMGVDVIEAGFPVTSPGDFEAVKEISTKVEGPTIAALSRAVKGDIEQAAKALKDANKPRIHTFIMTSKTQVEHQLRKSYDEVIKMASEAVALAKTFTDDVEFSPMDATRTDFDFLARIVRVAIEQGATVINIPDTVGYALPKEFGGLIKRLRVEVPSLNDVTISVHCHNDLGMAVANSIAAIENGATQIEGAINGLGERAGNTAIEELAMAIKVRKNDLDAQTGIDSKEINRTSRLVSKLTGYSVQYNKAIVGRNAFAHSSGIHQDGVLKERATYEIIDPKDIGLSESKIILGKTSGRHAFREHLKELGYSLEEEQFKVAFERFKDLADKKQEIIDDDIEAILADQVGRDGEVYKYVSMSVASGSDSKPQAEVVLSKDGQELKQSAEGDGPVDAVCAAIKEATKVDAKLINYNVSSITGGLDAQGDVSINLEIDGKPVLGRGVSTDIIEASAKAYLNAINKALAR
ncbi:MAG TPA: 2-isopropylmalate synthase [Actinobacteria bacterium]|nr:2-isopropylmalate synthase [Actinomycetota bacterium]